MHRYVLPTFVANCCTQQANSKQCLFIIVATIKTFMDRFKEHTKHEKNKINTIMRVNVKVFLSAVWKYLNLIINLSFSLLILSTVMYSIKKLTKKIQCKTMMRISINRTEHNGLL